MVESSILKVIVVVTANFIMSNNGETDIKHFNTINMIVDTHTDLKKMHTEFVIFKINENILSFTEKKLKLVNI